jgi:uncharacterized protein (DUF1330 family)
MSIYALNLFDLADNDDYLAYSRRSLDAVRKYGGSVVALGKLDSDAPVAVGDAEPRQALVLVEWPSREAFRGFLDDPEYHDLHPLRENGTRNYLWWAYERLEDLRPLLRGRETTER